MADTLSMMSARAVVPDQLLAYVHSVSGLKSVPCGSCILHQWEGEAVLVAYPLANPLDEDAMNESALAASRMDGIMNLTILSATVPDIATPDAVRQRDQYWRLPLPPPEKNAKLRNMLKRASTEVTVNMESGKNAWGEEHARLVDNFLARKKIDEDSAFLFGRLGDYLSGAPDAALFSARRADNTLAACAIGDFSALSTAFYMFAFRAPDAPPGTADLLLSSIINESVARGHEFLNLGLGIDPGVEFFKKKWHAEPWLPYVETALQLKKTSKSWFKRIFGG